MLAIARAMLAKPRLVLMDEPSMGLAPLVVEQVLESIAQINRNGIGVLLSEQNAKASLAIAHRGYVLAEGRVVLADDAEKLAAALAKRAPGYVSLGFPDPRAR